MAESEVYNMENMKMEAHLFIRKHTYTQQTTSQLISTLFKNTYAKTFFFY